MINQMFLEPSMAMSTQLFLVPLLVTKGISIPNPSLDMELLKPSLVIEVISIQFIVPSLVMEFVSIQKFLASSFVMVVSIQELLKPSLVVVTIVINLVCLMLS